MKDLCAICGQPPHEKTTISIIFKIGETPCPAIFVHAECLQPESMSNEEFQKIYISGLEIVHTAIYEANLKAVGGKK